MSERMTGSVIQLKRSKRCSEDTKCRYAWLLSFQGMCMLHSESSLELNRYILFWFFFHYWNNVWMKVGHFLGQPCFARGHQVSTLCAEQALNLFVRSVRPHTEIAIAYAQLYTMDEDKIPYILNCSARAWPASFAKGNAPRWPYMGTCIYVWLPLISQTAYLWRCLLTTSSIEILYKKMNMTSNEVEILSSKRKQICHFFNKFCIVKTYKTRRCSVHGWFGNASPVCDFSTNCHGDSKLKINDVHRSTTIARTRTLPS